MTAWRIRDIHTDDLDGILHLYEQQRSSGVTPVYALTEVLTSASEDVAVVATAQDGQIIGACVGRVAHNQARVVFHAVVTGRRGPGYQPEVSLTGSYGPLTVDAMGVICTGPACPDLTAPKSVIRLVGAADAGARLLPPLIAAFAQARGLRLVLPQTRGDGLR